MGIFKESSQLNHIHGLFLKVIKDKCKNVKKARQELFSEVEVNYLHRQFYIFQGWLA